MVNITLTDSNTVIVVDTTIYNDKVISKVLYWYADDFIITRENIAADRQKIVFTAKNNFTPEKSEIIKSRLSRDFVDYKTREIIQQETQDIRNILYVKAFANCDDFVEFDFTTGE